MRHKRQEETTTTPHIDLPNSNEHINDTSRPPHFGEDNALIILEPFVFLNQVNEHVVLEGVILR